mgnify:CR=1 FL=1
MSAINTINTNSQSGTELSNDKSEQPVISTKAIESKENIAFVDKVKLAEKAEKSKESEDKPSDVMTPKQLEKVAQQLQDFMGEMNRSLEFLVDKDSGRDVIKVLDRGTGDLVKQYPSEEVLTLISKLSDATGNLIDTEI